MNDNACSYDVLVLFPRMVKRLTPSGGLEISDSLSVSEMSERFIFLGEVRGRSLKVKVPVIYQEDDDVVDVIRLSSEGVFGNMKPQSGDVGSMVDEKFAGFIEAAGSLGDVSRIDGSCKWRVWESNGFKIVVRGEELAGRDFSTVIGPDLEKVMNDWVDSGACDELGRLREAVRKNETRREILSVQQGTPAASYSDDATMDDRLSEGLSGLTVEDESGECDDAGKTLKEQDAEAVRELELLYPQQVEALREAVDKSPVR